MDGKRNVRGRLYPLSMRVRWTRGERDAVRGRAAEAGRSVSRYLVESATREDGAALVARFTPEQVAQLELLEAAGRSARAFSAASGRPYACGEHAWSSGCGVLDSGCRLAMVPRRAEAGCCRWMVGAALGCGGVPTGAADLPRLAGRGSDTPWRPSEGVRGRAENRPADVPVPESASGIALDAGCSASRAGG